MRPTFQSRQYIKGEPSDSDSDGEEQPPPKRLKLGEGLPGHVEFVVQLSDCGSDIEMSDTSSKSDAGGESSEYTYESYTASESDGYSYSDGGGGSGGSGDARPSASARLVKPAEPPSVRRSAGGRAARRVDDVSKLYAEVGMAQRPRSLWEILQEDGVAVVGEAGSSAAHLTRPADPATASPPPPTTTTSVTGAAAVVSTAAALATTSTVTRSQPGPSVQMLPSSLPTATTRPRSPSPSPPPLTATGTRRVTVKGEPPESPERPARVPVKGEPSESPPPTPPGRRAYIKGEPFAIPQVHAQPPRRAAAVRAELRMCKGEFVGESSAPVEPTASSAGEGDSDRVRDATQRDTQRRRAKKPMKRTEDELALLYTAFDENPFPSLNSRAELAELLNLTQSQVYNWFHKERLRRGIRPRRRRQIVIDSSTSSSDDDSSDGVDDAPRVPPRRSKGKAPAESSEVSLSFGTRVDKLLAARCDADAYPDEEELENLAERAGIEALDVARWFMAERQRRNIRDDYGRRMCKLGPQGYDDLVAEFAVNPRPDAATMSQLAVRLEGTYSQVSQWFYGIRQRHGHVTSMTKYARKQSPYEPKALDALVAQFELNPYPDKATRKRLARAVGTTQEAIRAWFRNRRKKKGTTPRQKHRSSAKTKKKTAQRDDMPRGASRTVDQRARRECAFGPRMYDALVAQFDDDAYPELATVEALAKRAGADVLDIARWFMRERQRLGVKDDISRVKCPFGGEAYDELVASFGVDPYPDIEVRTMLAERCGTTAKEISKWFGHMRFRKGVVAGRSSLSRRMSSFTKDIHAKFSATYRTTPYPDTATLRLLARKSGQTVQQVRSWFDNERRKHKRQSSRKRKRSRSPRRSNSHKTNDKSKTIDSCKRIHGLGAHRNVRRRASRSESSEPHRSAETKRQRKVKRKGAKATRRNGAASGSSGSALGSVGSARSVNSAASVESAASVDGTACTETVRRAPQVVFDPQLYNALIDQMSVDPYPDIDTLRQLAELQDGATAMDVARWFAGERLRRGIKNDLPRNKCTLGPAAYDELMSLFVIDPNPATETKRQLATRNGGQLAQVNSWFKNIRASEGAVRSRSQAARRKCVFGPEGYAVLEGQFKINPDPDDVIIALAERVGGSVKQVHRWFDNRRRSGRR